jgi:hypothetical protein
MKIFKLGPVYQDGEHAFEALWPVRDGYWTTVWNFQCTPKLEQWDSTAALVEPFKPGAVAGDFPNLVGGALVLSGKAFHVLKDRLDECGEFLPLHSVEQRSFVLLNPLPCYDCLAHDFTQGRRFENGGWMFIERYCFRAESIPAAPVFKIVDETTGVFSSDVFKRAVEEAGLSGLEFREVWNDDGGPVETFALFDRAP